MHPFYASLSGCTLGISSSFPVCSLDPVRCGLPSCEGLRTCANRNFVRNPSGAICTPVIGPNRGVFLYQYPGASGSIKFVFGLPLRGDKSGKSREHELLHGQVCMSSLDRKAFVRARSSGAGKIVSVFFLWMSEAVYTVLTSDVLLFQKCQR